MGGNALQFDNGQFVVGDSLGSAYLMEVNGTGEGKRGLYVTSNGLVAIRAQDDGNVAINGVSSAGIAVLGESVNGYGVQGQSTNGQGVRGVSSAAGTGVYGESSTGYGILGASASGVSAIYGLHSASGTGVLGASTSGYGVQGTSTNSNGVIGQSTNTYGGNFSGASGVLASGTTYGVVGYAVGSGVYAYSTGSGYGVVPFENAGSAGALNSIGKALFNGTAATGSALVQIDSTTQGLLVPRMTTVQRDAIAAPATGLEIFNTTTNRKEWYNGTYWQGEAYSINLQANQSSPTASTTTYWGHLALQPSATAAIRKIYIRRSGVIRIAEIYSRANTAGDADNWSLYVRLNNTTDYLIQTVGVSASERVWSNTNINIPVVTGDYVEIKMINPAWVNEPANITFAGYLLIE
jgi:hypothetical protein